MKTKAQLMRDAKEGKISLEMVYLRNQRLNDRVTCVRPVVGANTQDIFIRTPEGDISYLHIPNASLITYTDDELIIYTPGFREPTAEETKILEEWEAVANTGEFQEQQRMDMLTDGYSTIIQKENFFKAKKAPQLIGDNFHNGARLDNHRRYCGEKEFIEDNNTKGEVLIAYKVHKE